MTDPDAPLTAGIVSRGVAAVVDLVVVGVVIGLLYLGLVLSRLLFDPTGFQLPALDVLFSTAAVLTVSALYLTASWAVSGCTVGAVVMGLRVVGRRSERVPLAVAIVRAIVDLGHSLGLSVVAEGVEEEAARDALRDMKCNQAQGFLIARPMPLDRFEAWLQARTVSIYDPSSTTHVLRMMS